MQKKYSAAGAAIVVLMLASCSSKVSLTKEMFSVTPNPLEAKAGEVAATINGVFPEKFMKHNAVVTVTPELRCYDGTVVRGDSKTYQGDKVLGNDQTVSYRLGGACTLNPSFAYKPSMQKSELYLTFDAYKGSKRMDIPEFKVADGVVATAELYKSTALADGGSMAPDAFQRVQEQKQEANIKFLVNQAQLRKSELESNSVKDFVAMLKKINADREGMNVQNVEIQAYASPEGKFDFNEKLAEKRQDAAQGYVEQQMKKAGVEGDIDAHYTAEDWDGFQQLVSVSDIQDKDVILRVLNMYKDPQEREQQIRNMSYAFRELADGILPELRRSRMIIHYETIGRNDEQILQQYKDDASQLSVEELIYGASIEDNAAKKEEMYKTTASLYPNDYRAYNNLAALAMAKGDIPTAERYLKEAAKINKNAGETYLNQGLIDLSQGEVEKAEQNIAKASTAGNVDISQAMGCLNIAKGNYTQAANALANSNTNTAALAQLLTGDYATAVQTLDKVKNPDATTDYLHAIAAARRGNKFAAKSYLEKAVEQDSSLQEYANRDIELNLLKE